MNNRTPSETVSKFGEKPRKFQVDCAIHDGEYEHGDSFIIECAEGEAKEQAYRELASLYACDEEDEEEIVNALRSEGRAVIGRREIRKVAVRVVEAVTVILRGGVIQEIQNIPEDMIIRVQDYDVEGATEEETKKDENGNSYVESVWEGVVPIL